MRRRNFIMAFVGGAAACEAWPWVANAQRPPVLGVLMAGLETAPDNQKRLAAFRQGLAELGWNEGGNIRIEYRWSSGQEELIRKYAGELVALQPDAILANSTPVVGELKRINATTPVVFALAIDPVGSGEVQSLAHPGGVITGFTYIEPELIGKWLELLKILSPDLTGAALLFNPATTPTYDKWLREIKAKLTPGEIAITPMHAASATDLEIGITALAQTGRRGLIIGPDPFNQVTIKEAARLALQSRVPTISVYRPFVVAGGLAAYGPDTADVFHRAAGYVDRILKGAKPADLPVQQPTKFEFVINMRTAKALNLTVPQLLLAQADEVIEW
jgi:putative ABC transport system substrate-binding protein